MAKTLLSMPDLRRRALAEIRQQPGCHNVQDIAINRVTDERVKNNWSLCVVSAGAVASLHPQILRSLPAPSLDNIEFNLCAFDEGAITGLLYFLNVNKDVPAAVVVLDETVASLFVKPLHSPARH